MTAKKDPAPTAQGRPPDTHPNPILHVAAPPQLKPALDPAAIAALRDLNSGDDSFFQDLVQIFLDDSPQRIAEIEQSLVKGDARQLTLAAHSLKGSSANFGAAQLRALSEQLELLGRQGSLGDAPAQLLALKDEFVRVRAALEALAPGK
jgi:HPt (histidine-containing phosphotransfer) domain-containing protein